MIKQITIDQFEEVMALIQDVTIDMRNNSIDQWDDIYPDSKIILSDIQNCQSYGFFCDTHLAGYIALNEQCAEDYDKVTWVTNDIRPLILHRLAIKSNFQGKGIAKSLINFSENPAKKNGYKSIRLDAFAKNPIAVGLYTGLGYLRSGEVNFRKGLFYCFEKKMVL